MEIFDKMDKKGKGEMSYKTFVKCLRKFKVKFNPNNINDIMLILDMNESETIDKKELEIYISDYFKKKG
jgi:Ca2+-binding EF-hand superfamily protein